MKIYVGNLTFDTDDDQLMGLFAPFGDVASASVVTDRYSGRSRGFGFVEMPSDEQGKAAIAELKGKEVGGRALTVDEARPQERSSGGGSRGYDRR